MRVKDLVDVALAVVNFSFVIDSIQLRGLVRAQVVEGDMPLTHQSINVILHRKTVGCVDEYEPVLTYEVGNEHRLEC